MKFESVGSVGKRRRQAAAHAALEQELPVLLNEALSNDTTRSAAVALLAEKAIPALSSSQQMLNVEGIPDRITVPRNLGIIDPSVPPTPELRKLVCCLVREGIPLQRAFRGIGLVRVVWESWWEQGESDAAAGLTTPYSLFVVELMREDVDIETVILRDMFKRPAGKWQAGMTFLERRTQDTYALQPQKGGVADAAKTILDYFSASAAQRQVDLTQSAPPALPAAAEESITEGELVECASTLPPSSSLFCSPVS